MSPQLGFIFMSINGLFDLWKILEIKLSLFPTVCKKLKDREEKKRKKGYLVQRQKTFFSVRIKKS